MDHYAVFGNPIHHSLSPVIHQLFAAQTNQHLIYTAKLIPLNDFVHAVNEFQIQGGKGLNITLPFKQDAFHLLEKTSERAQQAQAVNTICFYPDGTRTGDNTDGVGLLRDLTQNLKIHIHNKTILILGAGGAVRGILAPLLTQHPRQIVIANRAVEKAQILIKQITYLLKNTLAQSPTHDDSSLEKSNISIDSLLYNERFEANINHSEQFETNINPLLHRTQLEACSLSQLGIQTFDVIINGMSAGLHGDMPYLDPRILHAETFCYDLSYGKKITPFLHWAKTQGVKQYVDGLGMLIEQAAEAFYIWRDVKPETADVIAQLRNPIRY